jgi:heat shock protein HtpX
METALARKASPMDHDLSALRGDLDLLAGRAGVRAPRLHIVPVKAPIGAVLALPRRGHVFLSRGLLERLDRSEAAAVLAHEVAHLHHHDAALRLFAFWAFGLAALWAGVIYATLAMPGMGSFAALVSWLGALSVLRAQEWRADQTGARLLGDPEALARAVEKVHGDSPQAWLGGFFCTHPPPGQRAARLREMAAAQA